jgi:hypothetical protein
VPVILSVVLPEQLLAQSGGVVAPSHVDYHADSTISVHSDAPFTDGTAHNDLPHGDQPHSDVHTDSGPQPIHVDLVHGDGFLDTGFADGEVAIHADVGAQHTDNAHIDRHTDLNLPSLPGHVDLHADFPHLDFAVTVHADHSDGQPPNPGGGGAFTDHTDGFCRTTHGDNSHSDTNTHIDHYDITPGATLHNDHCDTQGGHADTGVGHMDVHADRHADIEHSDVHLDFTRP